MSIVDTKIKLVGRKILVRKCVTGVEEKHAGDTYYMLNGIAIPEKSHETQYWAEIIDVSDSCTTFSKDMCGKAFVRLAEYKPGFMFRFKGEDFIVKEELFELPASAGGLPAYIVWE